MKVLPLARIVLVACLVASMVACLVACIDRTKRTPSGAPILYGVPTTETPLEPGTRPVPSEPEGTDMLPEIEHIVVLMMENHSFDNYFGALGRGEGLTFVDGVAQNDNPTEDGGRQRAFHLPSTKQAGIEVSQDWASSHGQLGDGDNSGFALWSSKEAMGYFDEGDIPYYYSLAKVFPLCDRYFGSVLAQTYPNRRYLMAGTSHGMLTTDVPSSDEDPPVNGTIFEALSRNKVKWRDYAAIAPDLVLFPQTAARFQDHIGTIDEFLDDAARDKLPGFSLVTPNPGITEENPQDIAEGEAFSAMILDAVLDGPGWGKTILILTYDEHGGYYDHVVPPAAFPPDDVPPNAAELDGVPGEFDQLGFRVPTIVMSPYAKKDYVSHVVHDHTSILRLIETKWNLGALTRRDANASNLLDTLDLWSPPAFPAAPARARPKLGR